MAAIG
jgi:hypothetical protein